ncbi:MAG: hypothetical protein V1739_07870 [Candidatus Omnitrophota bacterium]
MGLRRKNQEDFFVVGESSIAHHEPLTDVRAWPCPKMSDKVHGRPFKKNGECPVPDEQSEDWFRAIIPS